MLRPAYLYINRYYWRERSEVFKFSPGPISILSQYEGLPASRFTFIGMY